MASYALSDLIAITRRLLGDNIVFSSMNVGTRSPGSYDDDDITDGLNFAIRRYIEAKPQATYLEASASLTTAGKAPLPTDFIIVSRVIYAGKELVKSQYDFEYMKNPSWQTTTGTVSKRWVAVDEANIKITPLTPATVAGGDTCTVGYSQMPTLLDASNEAALVDSRIPVNCQEFLKYAAAAYLLQMDNDEQSAGYSDKFMQTFHQMIGA